MIRINHKGDFKNTERFFKKVTNLSIGSILNRYGSIGVNALAAATPVDSGLTANSWDFNVEVGKTRSKITWINKNNQNGSNIAILLQYGHGTGTGGYVEGRDFINPAMRPIFDKLAEDVWKEVADL